MIQPDVARRIKLVGLDVDGVLTDGGVYLGSVGVRPTEFKRYDIQDGVGIQLLRYAGIKTAIVTGRVSDSVAHRARELNVDDLAQDADARKLPLWRAVLKRQDVEAADAAFVGDDFPDMAILREVGLPVAVGNAVPEIKAVCTVRLSRSGGHGAVREFCEILLKTRGEWDHVWERYVADKSLLHGVHK